MVVRGWEEMEWVEQRTEQKTGQGKFEMWLGEETRKEANVEDCMWNSGKKS